MTGSEPVDAQPVEPLYIEGDGPHWETLYIEESERLLRLLDRLWNETDVPGSQGHRVCDLFAHDDPLTIDITATLAALDATATEERTSGPCIECGYHRNIEPENSRARAARLARHQAHALAVEGASDDRE